eukprot:TRINITY_DN271_c0_g1_i2.p1 TRINITY_DN271_c0_g1~~TRINITY_DN271_c0_g1_i2.p1  ORF type:complete len:1622 (+),score=573.31 TRINITY_DN271_c0_g1_i2:82-4866(+)
MLGAGPGSVRMQKNPSSLRKKAKQSNYAELEKLAKKHNEEFHEITAFQAGVDKSGDARADDAGAMRLIQQAFELRRKYQAMPTQTDEVAFITKGKALQDTADCGSPTVMGPLMSSSADVSPSGSPVNAVFSMPSYSEFVSDLELLQAFVGNGPVHSVCHARLRLLEEKFELHKISNSSLESQANQFDDKDFMSIMKADVCNQLASGMSPAKLLECVRGKLKNSPDVEVQDDRTLKELFDELGITADNVTLDKLGVQAPDDEWGGGVHDELMGTGQQPSELGEVHSIFLSHRNYMDGVYFAELVRGVFQTAKEDCVLIEPRVPICGQSSDEFSKLATWAAKHSLLDDGAMWAIQIPARSWSRGRWHHTERAGSVCDWNAPTPGGLQRATSIRGGFGMPSTAVMPGTSPTPGAIVPAPAASGRRVSRQGRRASAALSEPIPVLPDYQAFLDNIFAPVLRASEDPEGHPELAQFLEHVGVFAIGGDERTEVAPGSSADRIPSTWTDDGEPPYHWQMFYIAFEINRINNVRREKGLNSFRLRPVAGEGFEATLPLMASYLLAHGITNCVRLAKMPPLEYLYYLWQIGISLSFIGANRYHTPFHRNPMITHFRRGLNVCLCSGEPLRTHSTGGPLIEEYSLFQKTFQLSTTDISEMARNSVLQSTFPHECKCSALGERYWLQGSDGNDPDRTNVADMRMNFRGRVLATEMSKILGQDLEARDESWQLSDEAAAVTEPHSFTRVRVTNLHVLQDSQERRYAAQVISEAVELRFKYLPRKTPEEMVQHEEHMVRALQSGDIAPLLHGRGEVQMLDGVLTLTNRQGASLLPFINHIEFLSDYDWLLEMINTGNVQQLAETRLKTLLTMFQIHKSMNSSLEGKTTGDFYSCAKVDNHIHMAAGMSSKELLEFIQEKVRRQGDDIVSFKSNKTQTLDEVYRSLGIDINSLTVDDLDVMADSDQLFHRFDRFNDKYNPLGSPALRECFLKTDNFMAGRYFAELCKRVLDRVAADGYYTELRLSIYGRKDDEWDKLARWAVENNVERPCNRWLIQVPRIYHVFRKQKMVQNFGQVLRNIFAPLWQVSVDPRSNWQLHIFLKSVAGFDSVDNEKITDAPWTINTPVPDTWDTEQNPPYAYWLYYMYANLQTLNQFRRERGLTTFTLRPHCGESGAPQHLAVAFLLADGINHGINLRKSMTLQYLYYLTQLPVSCSPLSNNALFLPLQKNPFPQLFNAGLNITLSTDDPLQFHLTQESLIEEYSIAAKLWKHTTTDLVEMARNSMLMSGFPYSIKANVLGPLYMLSSSNGNQRYKSRLSDIRVSFRYETLDQETRLLAQLSASEEGFPACFSSKCEEEELITRFALSGGLTPTLQAAIDHSGTQSQKKSGQDTARSSRRQSGRELLPLQGQKLAPLPSPATGAGRRISAQQQYAMYFQQHSGAPAPARLAWPPSPHSGPSMATGAAASPSASTAHMSGHAGAFNTPDRRRSAPGGHKAGRPVCVDAGAVRKAASGIRVSLVNAAAGEGTIIMRTRCAPESDAPSDKRWESLRQCITRILTEELPEYAAQGFAVLSRDRMLLRQWEPCIDEEGEVVVRLTPHTARQSAP